MSEGFGKSSSSSSRHKDRMPSSSSSSSHKKKKRGHSEYVDDKDDSYHRHKESKKAKKQHEPYIRDKHLKPRINDYLAKNITKRYIDIDDMSRYLYGKYPEYGRKKYKDFQRQVGNEFSRITNGGKDSKQVGKNQGKEDYSLSSKPGRTFTEEKSTSNSSTLPSSEISPTEKVALASEKVENPASNRPGPASMKGKEDYSLSSKPGLNFTEEKSTSNSSTLPSSEISSSEKMALASDKVENPAYNRPGPASRKAQLERNQCKEDSSLSSKPGLTFTEEKSTSNSFTLPSSEISPTEKVALASEKVENPASNRPGPASMKNQCKEDSSLSSKPGLTFTEEKNTSNSSTLPSSEISPNEKVALASDKVENPASSRPGPASRKGQLERNQGKEDFSLSSKPGCTFTEEKSTSNSSTLPSSEISPTEKVALASDKVENPASNRPGPASMKAQLERVHKKKSSNPTYKPGPASARAQKDKEKSSSVTSTSSSEKEANKQHNSATRLNEMDPLILEDDQGTEEESDKMHEVEQTSKSTTADLVPKSPATKAISNNGDESANNSFMQDTLFKPFVKQPQAVDTDMLDLSHKSEDVTKKEEQNVGKANVKKPKKTLATAIVPTETFASVGGCEKTLDELEELAEYLKYPPVHQEFDDFMSRGCLLHGPPGCGKTLIANALAGQLDVPILTIQATKLVSGISGSSEGKIREAFEQAKDTSPCILFLDNIEVIAKKQENSQREMEMRMTQQLINCIDDLNVASTETGCRVFVLGATSTLEVIDPALRIGSRLEQDLPVGIPDEKARFSILRIMCKDKGLSEADLKYLARMTPGFVGADLQSLLRAAARQKRHRRFQTMKRLYQEETGTEAAAPLTRTTLLKWIFSKPWTQVKWNEFRLGMEDADVALKKIKPSAMKEGLATVPDVSFEDIGALDHVKKQLRLAICGPVLYPKLTKTLGLDKPGGVLLFGPPGCGKTLLAKAVANQAGINFISVKGPEFISKFVGDSERAVRQIFQRARNSAPCVIFFDELDSICPNRSGDHAGTGSNRVVTQMLTEMDGVESREGVYIMGATNRLDIIDPAILRPGRITRQVFVDLPDEAGRVEILRKHTRNGTQPRLAPDVDLKEIARNCPLFTGADLMKLVSEAATLSFEECLEDQGSCVNDKEGQIANNHFLTALSTVNPSVSEADMKKYKRMNEKLLKARGKAQEDSTSSSPQASAKTEPTIDELPPSTE